MNRKYKVTGMTCSGCSAKVEYLLSQIPGVERATVNLEKGEVEIAADEFISAQTLQNALPGKYAVSDGTASVNNANIPGEPMESQGVKALFPLFLILAYIGIAAFLINRSPWNANGFMLDFMGLFFIVFSFFKMLDLKNFPDSFQMYDPLAQKIRIYAVIYPFIETALGLFFLLRLQIDFALIATVVVLGITTVGVAKSLLDKKAIRCACLGTALKLPMTKATLIENALMMAMSLAMLFNG